MPRVYSDESADESLISNLSSEPTKAVIYNRSGTKSITIIKSTNASLQVEEEKIKLEPPNRHTLMKTKKKKRKSKKLPNFSEEEPFHENMGSGGDELSSGLSTKLQQYNCSKISKLNTLSLFDDVERKIDNLWDNNFEEEWKRIKIFWSHLSEKDRRELVKIEKGIVLKQMHEQKRHSCLCSTCDMQRHDRNLYANFRDLLDELPVTNEWIDEIDIVECNELTKVGKHLSRVYSSLDHYLALENNLKIENGIVTVIDDLIKNSGEKCLELIENLVEQQEKFEEAETEINDCYDEYGSEETEIYDEEEDTNDTLNQCNEAANVDQFLIEKHRIKSWRIFQELTAKLLRQRILQAYREKVANERQQRLLEEIEEETQRKQKKEECRLKKKERKKDKKRLFQERKEQLRLKKADEQYAREEIARAEKEAETKRRREEHRQKAGEFLQEQMRIHEKEKKQQVIQTEEIISERENKLVEIKQQKVESYNLDTRFPPPTLPANSCSLTYRIIKQETSYLSVKGKSKLFTVSDKQPSKKAIDLSKNFVIEKSNQLETSPCFRPFYQQTLQAPHSSSTTEKSNLNEVTVGQLSNPYRIQFETTDPVTRSKNVSCHSNVTLGGGQGLGFDLLVDGNNSSIYSNYPVSAYKTTWDSITETSTKVIRPPRSKAVSRPSSTRKSSEGRENTGSTLEELSSLSSTISLNFTSRLWGSPFEENTNTSQPPYALSAQQSSLFINPLFTEHKPYVSPQRYTSSQAITPTMDNHDNLIKSTQHLPSSIFHQLHLQEDRNDSRKENDQQNSTFYDPYYNEQFTIWKQFRQVYFHLESTIGNLADYTSGWSGFYPVIELCRAHSDLFKTPLVEHHYFYQVCQTVNQIQNGSDGAFVFRRTPNQVNPHLLARYEVNNHPTHFHRFLGAPQSMDSIRQPQYPSWPNLFYGGNSGFSMAPTQLPPPVLPQVTANNLHSMPFHFALKQSAHSMHQPTHEYNDLSISNGSIFQDMAIKSIMS